MKTRFWSVTILLLLVIMVLAACSPQPATQPEVEQQPMEEAATEAPMEEMATEMPEETVEEMEPTESEMEAEEPAAPMDVNVEALIEERVAGKHDLDRIFNATKTREEWNETLDRMNGYGAKISEEEKQIIIDFLLSR